jgi:hypothetical protein
MKYLKSMDTNSNNVTYIKPIPELCENCSKLWVSATSNLKPNDYRYAHCMANDIKPLFKRDDEGKPKIIYIQDTDFRCPYYQLEFLLNSTEEA